MRINYRFLVILLILMASSITLSVFAFYNDQFPGDLWLAQGIQSINNDFLTMIMKGISIIFDTIGSIIIVICTGLLLWWRTGWKDAVLVIVGGLLSATGTLFKAIIDRPRPSPDLVTVFSPPDTSSFPSGHSFFVVMILGLSAYFTVTRLQNKPLRMAILAICIALILLVGISRIYLGAHWPSDVYGGYLTGGVFLTILIWVDIVWLKKHLRETSKPGQHSDTV